MQTSLHLNFDGQCEEASRFYERCLGGQIKAILPYEGSPAASQVPSEFRQRVLHACLEVGGQILMGCDAPPNRYEAPKGFSVSLTVKDARDAERIFQTLAEGGQVRMPMQETFWAQRFGMAVDRFAIPWMINREKASAGEPVAAAAS